MLYFAFQMQMDDSNLTSLEVELSESSGEEIDNVEADIRKEQNKKKVTLLHPLQLVLSSHCLHLLLISQSENYKLRDKFLPTWTEIEEQQSSQGQPCHVFLTMPGLLVYPDRIVLTKTVCDMDELISPEVGGQRSNQYVTSEKYLVLHHHWKQFALLLALLAEMGPVYSVKQMRT